MATWDTDDLHRFEIPIGDRRYPEALAQTPRPPKMLYVIGDPDVLSGCVAVVGARRATPYGLHCADRFAGWLAGAGYVVVSGGAVGCDQAAHRAALSEGAPTVAVMGCGADVLYPSDAASLLRRIASTGAVVSELPWGRPPARWAFRERNRIIAGLSVATLIVEAALPSGTFSTADYALEAGREVMAVPGSILAPESRGSNRLIAQGATAVVDVETLSAAVGMLLGPHGAVPTRGEETGLPDEACDPLFSAVRADPMRPDDLARALGMDIVAVARGLAALEISGLVTRMSDGRYGANPKRSR